MAMIYFLNGNQEVIKIVRNSAILSAIQTQELPEDNSLLRDYLSVRLKNDERLFNAQYMAIKTHSGNRNAFDLYRTASEIVPDNATEFTGVQVAPYELEGVVIEDLRPQNRPLNQTMNQVLADSDWRLGYVADNLPSITTNFYYVSVKDALKKIQELANVEMLFKVEINGNSITDKWVEVYHQLGNRTMKRFNYGTNALSVVRESSHDELYTALIGHGKGEEVGETESGDATHGRKINFADVEWKKSVGNPVDKPKGQKYIELPNATAEYGIKLIDGRKVPRIGIVEFNDTDDPEKLIQETYQELLVRARPKVLFKASVINTGDMLIGDTVTIHRHDLDFHYQARVRKVVRDRKNNNKTQVEIGDVVHTPSTKRQGQINSALNNVASDLENVRGEITEARSSADGKNTNFYGNVEPNRKKVGDTWFRDHPSLTGESQILVWNGEAWELIMDTSETTKNADAIEEQKKDIDEAKKVADDAVSEINEAIASAGFSSLVDLTDSLGGRTSALDVKIDGITGIVTDYDGRISTVEQLATGLQTTVANKASQSQVTQLANGLSSVVSDMSSLMGGRNLLLDSEKEHSTMGTTFPILIMDSSHTPMTVGEQYTLSFDLKADSNVVSSHVFLNNSTTIWKSFNITTEWTRHFVTFEYDGENFLGYQIYPHLYLNDGNVRKYARRIQLEEGSVATPWSDSTEGIQSQITQLSDNINLRVTKGELLSQINIEADRQLFQSGKILFDAENVVFSGTAWMDGAVIANASIDGAKIQDATIGSAKIANLDVDKISGNTTNFVQSAWNELNTQVHINGSRIRISGTDSFSEIRDGAFVSDDSVGTRMRLSNGRIVAYDRRQTNNWGTLFHLGANRSTITPTTGGMLGITHQEDFTIGRYWASGSAETTGITEYLKFGYSGSRVESNGIITAHKQIRTLEGIRFMADSLLSFPGGEIRSSSANVTIEGQNGVNIYRDGVQKLRFRANIIMDAALDTNGYAIIESSDKRLKYNILDTQVNSLKEIKSMTFYEFDRTNGNHDDIGVIAQDTLSLATYDEERDLWGINSSKQRMMNSHAIQQLAIMEENTNKIASQALQATETNEEKIHQLQQELSKANRRIEELESVI